ncbi:MAG TPA: DUF1566 domain-containing protein [Phycisphaerales bacterium]|nr:DUF1566 domain-containing protein [Phycisphaerales bacterium]HCD31776.1 DUF1566 domain-containing protein [Phycisphaerales bacterium]
MLVIVCVSSLNLQAQSTTPWPYTIVDTGQLHIFNNRSQLKSIPTQNQSFYGQDAQYTSNPPRYQNNNDGTITDLNTGLMWEKGIHENMTLNQAESRASSIRTAGHSDWRLPTIKELYSLMDFNGSVARKTPVPYIDTQYFDFKWGNKNSSNRIIDAQFLSATKYVGTTMGNNPTVFGVNFADGRIKGYPISRFKRFVRYVRSNPDYGKNQFVDNNDNTISDQATGLMWAKVDSNRTMNWQSALSYAENQRLAGYSDWRLPNAKELQSIVDYSRAPDATDRTKRGAAIDPIFEITKTESYFWTSTTHYDGPSYDQAVYVAFGQAMGNFAPPRSSQAKQWMNVHGAGAQRSDPKSGSASRFSEGRGPQGDDIRIYNYVRVVRNINPDEVSTATPSTDALPKPSLSAMGGPGGSHDSQRRRPPEGRMPPPRR